MHLVRNETVAGSQVRTRGEIFFTTLFRIDNMLALPYRLGSSVDATRVTIVDTLSSQPHSKDTRDI